MSSVSRIQSPIPRHTADGFVARSRRVGTYNRTSLALDFNSATYPLAQPDPQLFLRRYDPASPVKRVPMFNGLDASNPNRGSGVLAFLVHVLIALTIVWLGMVVPPRVVQSEETTVPIQSTLYDPPPPLVMPVAKVQGGGGGGGAHELVAPNRGQLPKTEKAPPLIRPEAAKIERPKLPVEPTTQIRMQQTTTMPTLGAPQSPQVALASQGSGSGSGFGFGLNGGTGSGNGSGVGPGSNGGYGGGVMNVGGGVSAPRLIYSVEPQFTEDARQANYQGEVSIQLIVDSQGFPQDIHVVRHLGMGLDERAVEAVRQYRFKPAMYQGHPVAVQMIVNVDFRLH
jgi:protein TonB